MKARERGTGEKGLAAILTGLLLIPLMTFAAFGVDLASWYSRISFLQKSADAAALAGTVWMPNLGTATTAACASLAQNGIVGNGLPDGDCVGAGGTYEVDVARSSTSLTAVRVTVTDPNAKRTFSQVFSTGSQRLSRSAEAEYNLPIPLGSPLNFFGGDSSKTAQPPVTTFSVTWPTNYSSRAPANAPCNIGTSASQNLGGWTNATTYSATAFSTTSPQCEWAPAVTIVSTPPANATTLAPTNVPCNRQQAPSTQQGRWNTGTPPTYTNNRHTGTAATGNRQCTWAVVDVTTLPPNHTTSSTPTNRGCNIPPQGRWVTSGAFAPNVFYNSGTENRLCRWRATIGSTTVTPPNPIVSPSRDPGFWAQIHGPGADQQSGDAYSTRCLTSTNCGSPDNALYVDPTNPDHGYWYVVKIPDGAQGQTVLRVFDAQLTPGPLADGAGDSTITGSSMSFTTSYRVYRQTNPLDFSSRVPVTPAAANQTPNSCNWDLQQEASFRLAWVDLCTVNAAVGETYLINVRTTSISGVSNSAGRNGYALEACRLNGCAKTDGTQPSLHARDRMVLYNNISSGDSTFYIAEVGPQYAGRTLVLDLFDPGESSGTAWLYPRRPTVSAPGAIDPVPTADCTITSTRAGYPRSSDLNNGGVCSVRTADSGALYNGQWMSIRIAIPPDYTCFVGRDPVDENNSCWWGMRYSFGGSGSPTDTTTWKASIEGNPVHLTE